ncbi:MAG: NirD/YgiW/YdeI family stress tolerance protein [Bacteroidales bacterium]|nr:NirD/YgiW/YdeI family stress tolerance protein [Bacteroidales bacterium]
MKKIFFCLLITLTIGIVLVFVFSTTKGIQKNTVKDIIENAVELDKREVRVALKGVISSPISQKKKRFWFEDSTGQVIIEVKSHLMPMVPTTDTIQIEIRGEVDCEIDDGDGVKIEVDEIILDEVETNEEELFTM